MSRAENVAIVVGDQLPLIAAVKATEKLNVEVVWSGGTVALIDLAPDIYAFKFYAPLREDRKLFESVEVGDDGNSLSWGDGAIDMPATAVERLVSDKMSAESLQAFMHAAKLTRDGLAAQLGVSRRLVGYWLKGQTIPRYIALACRALAAEFGGSAQKTLLAVPKGRK